MLKKIWTQPYIYIALLVGATVGVYLYTKYIIKTLMTSTTNPNVKAFLMMIRQCEGTSGPNGYRTMFGGKLAPDLSKHPNVCVPYKNTCSTAAGAYQFLYRTWQTLSLRLGLKDFSAASQDLAALELIREKGALNNIINGNIEIAIKKVAKIWASLPGAGYGQPEKSITQCLSYYKAAGGNINNNTIA